MTQNKTKWKWHAIIQAIVLGMASVQAADPDPAECAKAAGELAPPKPVTPVAVATPADGSSSLLALSLASVNALPAIGENQAGAQTEFATRFASGFLSFDSANPRTADNVRKGMREFDKRIIDLSPTLQSTSLATTIQALSTSTEGAEIGRHLMELDKTMKTLDFPTTFREPPKSWAGRLMRGALDMLPGLPITVQAFFQRYQTAQGLLDEQIKRINTGIDAQEVAINGEYQANADQISAARAKLYDLDKFLEILYIEVEKVHKSIPADSANYKFIEREVLTHIADRRVSTNRMINTLQQAEEALILLIGTGRELNTKARDEVAQATVSIQAGVIIAKAINEQATIRKGAEALRKTAEAIQKTNAENLLAHSLAVNGFLIANAQIDQLVANSNTYATIRAEREKAQATRLQTYKEALPKLVKLREDMERMVQETRKEVGLDEALTGTEPVAKK